jgi:hypothetical protein
MTANWPQSIVNVLLAGFFAVTLLGIGIAAYAARALKQAEDRAK